MAIDISDVLEVLLKEYTEPLKAVYVQDRSGVAERVTGVEVDTDGHLVLMVDAIIE
ncbi:hypothetical protein 278BB001_20 [Bacillus phage 278BB001]|nr:hypothetical protein 010DV004_29 [Bacillus phage 010DV004]QZA69246.1 hypothetical protein 010DV005_29 [Bacillus phage 010DV005]QZA69815.1 hypothetical protein 043JT007_29 [Bacillus phage 043JT007]QZA70171.1 hypothetical protein 278BB001_20 [Bacillus phage 278BB001]